VKYLISKGITPERLVAKGYGETKPIARNTNPDGTDNPAGRQLNRRTEFRILEIGNIQVKKPVDEPEDDDDRFFKKNE
jgi:flagellar motor protein MotB